MRIHAGLLIGAVLGFLVSFWLSLFISFPYLTPILVLGLSGTTAYVLARTRYPGLVAGILVSAILVLGVLTLQVVFSYIYP